MSACIRADPTGRISVKFVIGDLHEKCAEKIHICIKWGKNIGHFMRRPKYVILLPVTLNCSKSALFEWSDIRLFRGGINVTRTCLSVSLYSSWPLFWRLTGTLWVIVNVNIELSPSVPFVMLPPNLRHCFYVLLTVHLGIIFVNNQLDAQFFFHVCLFLFSTCFGQPCAHYQEN